VARPIALPVRREFTTRRHRAPARASGDRTVLGAASTPDGL